ncbi:MAG: hypothetical protein NUV46_01830 [Nanoarchaeota archaeon]|nr:hypothetical protein [Nanoarchaeota archaeon]
MKQIRAPSVEDFSKEATKKALNKSLANNTTFLGFSSATVLSLLYTTLFGFPPAGVIATVGAGVVAGGTYLYKRFIKAESFGHEYFENLRKEVERITELKRENLKESLVEVGCIRGKEQLEAAEGRFERFCELLGEKLNAGELAYKRYMGITQEVFLSIVDNLSEVVNLTKSLLEIDVKRVEKRKKSIHSDGIVTDVEKAELDVLEKRLQLLRSQQDKVEFLLLQNEKAITLLDETSASIGSMKTFSGESNVNMEDSMSQLSEMVQLGKELSKDFEKVSIKV